jgi:hypothetical protein
MKDGCTNAKGPRTSDTGPLPRISLSEWIESNIRMPESLGAAKRFEP